MLTAIIANIALIIFAAIGVDFIRKHNIKAKKSDSYDIQRIARSIGYFYQHAYSDQNQPYIREAIERLKIYELKMTGNVLWITLGRPGLLIGKRGENIDALLKYLQNDNDLKDMKIEKIMLKESVDLNALFSYEALYKDYSYDPTCDDFEFERETLPE